MTHQVALTVIARVKLGHVRLLKRVLSTINSDVANNTLIPFRKLSGVHFARMLVLDESTDLDGSTIEPYLVLMSDVDAPLQRHLHELVSLMGAGLDAIYSHCEGYPTDGPITAAQRLSYLRAHMVSTATVYVNTIGRTVEQIRQEAYLREAVEDFLDRHKQDWPHRTPQEVRAAILAYIDGDEGLHWARKPPKQPGLLWRIKDRMDFVAPLLLLLFLLPLIIVGLPVYIVLLRLHELRDTTVPAQPGEAHIQELAEIEDHVVQNQYSAIGFVKRSRFRVLTATTVLWLANWGTRHIFNRANLAGVKTIHFARWVFLDGKRRLIFASNYDGSLESYMDDFIDKVAWGLNGVFSNGVAYPRTNWLIRDGARDEQAFKRYIRDRQIPTQVWFAAYPQLTALNIENNARIREGLSASLSPSGTETWLSRF